jgi:hypothetical protein
LQPSSPAYISKPMQNQMNEAIQGLALMAAFIAVFGIGGGLLVSRQSHKWRALAEAEREAEREAAPHAS